MDIFEAEVARRFVVAVTTAVEDEPQTETSTNLEKLQLTDEPQTEMVKCYKCRWWNYSYGCGNPKGICEFEERYQVKRSE